MRNDLRWEVIVCFVDIHGIVDQHCFKIEYRKGSKNGQSRETGNKTNDNKAKTQDNMTLCSTPLCVSKHK